MNAKDFDLLRRSDLFRFLPDKHFEKIRSLLQEERHDFGDLIVKQCEPASAFYILISGRARAVKSRATNGGQLVLATLQPGDRFGEAALTKGGPRTPTCRRRTQVNLAFYRDGDFFGELSILNGSPRAASVEAYSDCDLLALDPDAVRSLKQSYPEFGKLLEERLAQYKAKAEARVPLDFTEELVPAETLA